MNARLLRKFDGASYTGTPVPCQIGREQAVPFLSRPAGGGPICLLSVLAGDGRDLLPPIDLRPLTGCEEHFGVSLFVSAIDGTVKVFVNCKVGGGNDRGLYVLETGITPEVTR